MSLTTRLRTALAATATMPAPYVGDMREEPVSPGTPAAVLIALTDRAEPGLILTQRPETMRAHAGQVAFPGGRIDSTDSDAVDAALREAEEEIALSRTHVEVIDTLGPYRTVTGYAITPVVAVITPDLRFVPDPREVAAVFEVPLAFLLDPANRLERRMVVDGIDRCYFEHSWDGRRIWGATAAMLANFAARLQW